MASFSDWSQTDTKLVLAVKILWVQWSGLCCNIPLRVKEELVSLVSPTRKERQDIWEVLLDLGGNIHHV